MPITGVMQDYMKTIYKLQRDRGAVSTSEIAERLHVSAASATNMVKRLARLKLVSYTRYHGFVLAPAGQRIALEIIRHHRLIELYLARELNISLDQVDSEAEKMEHVLSEDVEAHMASSLGNPTVDPHGDPIPSVDGTVQEVRYPTLDGLPAGETGMVTRLSDRSPALLRRLTKVGVLPGVVLKMRARHATNYAVEISGRDRTLPREAGTSVYIQWLGAPLRVRSSGGRGSGGATPASGRRRGRRA